MTPAELPTIKARQNATRTECREAVLCAAGIPVEKPSRRKTLFRSIVEIAAPPATVWRVMADVERWPEWTPSVRRVKLLTPGPLRVGSRARIQQPGFPPAWWRVTELEADRGFTWVSTVPGLRVTGKHWIEAMNDGCRVTLSIYYDGWLGPLLASCTASINNRYLAMEADGLQGAKPKAEVARKI
jgi:uncharacterized membrane protein